MHDMASSGARGALTRYEVVPVKGETFGKISLVFRIFGQMNWRGKVASLIGYGCVSDEQAAHPDSSRHSEQLSCRKYFHLSYGLFYMIF